MGTLSSYQTAIVLETLRMSLAAASADVDESQVRALAQAASALGPSEPHSPPHPLPHDALPRVGASVREERIVSADDTAAAMGHPDDSVQVLGSPRLALWFELVASGLLPAPSPSLTHVGVGILVHHLGRADVGETVVVECSCASVSGRRAAFTCRATVGDRVVGLGVHQRALLLPRGG